MIIHLIFIILIPLAIILYKQREPFSFDKSSAKPIWNKIGTYWPMVPVNSEKGNIFHNLWALYGCLHKYDLWMRRKHNIKSKAREYESQPFFNWLINKPSGHYIPQIFIDSTNFEQTSGVNINQSGSLNSNILFDLKEIGLDNKERIESWWWGSCDLTAKASQMFTEPKKIFIDQDIIFTTHDIKGLLAIISDVCNEKWEKISNRYRANNDIIIKKDGAQILGTIINLDISKIPTKNIKKKLDNYIIKNLQIDLKVKIKDEITTIPKEDIQFVKRETMHDFKAIDFHNTVIKWINQDRPFSMDIDKDMQVWNYSFGRVLITEIPKNKLSIVEKKLYRLLQKQYPIIYRIRILNITLFQSDNKTEEYKYWIVEDFKKKVVSSGWISSKKPDFMWRCQLKSNWQNIKINPRNPDVTPYYVNQLYQMSIL